MVCRVDEIMSQSEWILDENFYFVRAERNDDFGQATIIETAGGGVEEAIREYEYRSNTRLGKLIANRELPVLHRAKEIIDI